MAKEIKVPNIGDFEGVEVIDVLVKSGDTVAKDDSLITLESDKAAMDVPAPFAGKITEVKIKAGDKVSEGDVIALAEDAGDSGSDGEEPRASKSEEKTEPRPDSETETQEEQPAPETQQPAGAAGPAPSVGPVDVREVAGDDAGRIIATGTPEEVAQVGESYTGKFLREMVGG